MHNTIFHWGICSESQNGKYTIFHRINSITWIKESWVTFTVYRANLQLHSRPVGGGNAPISCVISINYSSAFCPAELFSSVSCELHCVKHTAGLSGCRCSPPADFNTHLLFTMSHYHWEHRLLPPWQEFTASFSFSFLSRHIFSVSRCVASQHMWVVQTQHQGESDSYSNSMRRRPPL